MRIRVDDLPHVVGQVAGGDGVLCSTTLGTGKGEHCTAFDLRFVKQAANAAMRMLIPLYDVQMRSTSGRWRSATTARILLAADTIGSLLDKSEIEGCAVYTLPGRPISAPRPPPKRRGRYTPLATDPHWAVGHPDSSLQPGGSSFLVQHSRLCRHPPPPDTSAVCGPPGPGGPPFPGGAKCS